MAATTLLMVRVHAQPSVSASSAVLMDAQSGRILWEKNADQKALIASTTKIMTGLLIAECCDVQETVVVPQAAVGIEGSSLYLRAGERISVETLLYGMMLQSGNDAAVALALHCDGSLNKFVRRMNDKAALLGLNNTMFANPHGLDHENNYSTAADLAVLASVALENETFHHVVSTKTISFQDRVFTNHNKLLWQYDGAIGVKTGYTRSAGRILVSAVERDGKRLIAVTFNAPNDWCDHKAMLDYGFEAYTDVVAIEAGEPLAVIKVVGGVCDNVSVCTHENFAYPTQTGEQLTVKLLLPQFLYAPIFAGTCIGKAVVSLNENEISELPIYCSESVWEGV